MGGRIEVLAGGMFSGKTEELLRRVKRLDYSKASFLLFKPSVDTRDSADSVVSRQGARILARPVNSAAEVLEAWLRAPARVVAIDEAQFFDRRERPSLVRVAQQLAGRGARVIVAGLDMNAAGEPFGLMPELMAVADEVTKLKACCAVCGEDAGMSFRRSDPELAGVDIGGEDKYEARCLAHWHEGQAAKAKK
jgi:thymidine kinase